MRIDQFAEYIRLVLGDNSCFDVSMHDENDEWHDKHIDLTVFSLTHPTTYTEWFTVDTADGAKFKITVERMA